MDRSLEGGERAQFQTTQAGSGGHAEEYKALQESGKPEGDKIDELAGDSIAQNPSSGKFAASLEEAKQQQEEKGVA